jgi:site-specific DNA-cytosine methylase
MYTLTENDVHAVAFQQNTRDEVRLLNGDGQIAGALAAEAGMKQQNYIAQAVAFTKSKRAQSTTDDETWVEGAVAPTMSLFDQGDVRATTVAVAFKPGNSARARSIGAQVEVSCTLDSNGGGNGAAVAHGVQVQWASGGGQVENNTAQALRSNAEHNYQFARIAMTVRRLTPVECERLQGFPDNYTLIPWRKKPAADCPDGPRYKALGNSMAVNCMEWIGERIAACDGATA